MTQRLFNTNIIALALILVFTSISCKSTSQEAGTQDQKMVKVEQVKQGSYKDISVSEAQKMIYDNKDLIIIDVRTPEEVAAGKIEGALEININDSDFASKMSALDKDKEYLVYCKSGGRSGRCMNKMKDLGFKSVYNMEGGYSSWK